MKNIGLLLVAITHSIYLYSMELPTLYTYGTTKINVTKGYHYNLDGKVDCLVFGKNEQQLRREKLTDNWLVGQAEIVCNKILYKQGKDFVGSDSEDDTYHSCYDNLIEKSQKNNRVKFLQSMCIAVTEPLIFMSQYSGAYYYYAEKKYKEGSGHSFGIKYFGDEAIEQASNDLALCYNNILSVGLEKIYNKKGISIAIPALATAVDFPREKAVLAAIPAILKFVKNNPDAYDSIELFVKKRSEFALYKKWLNFYVS